MTLVFSLDDDAVDVCSMLFLQAHQGLFPLNDDAVAVCSMLYSFKLIIKRGKLHA